MELYNQAYEETGDIEHIGKLHEFLESYYFRLEETGRLEDIPPRALEPLNTGLDRAFSLRVQEAKRAYANGEFEDSAYQARTCYSSIRMSKRTEQRSEWILLLASRASREAWLSNNQLHHLQQAKTLLQAHILLGSSGASRQVKGELFAVRSALKAANISDGASGDRYRHEFPDTPRDQQLGRVTRVALATSGVAGLGGALLAGTAISRDDLVEGAALTKTNDWEQLGIAIPLAVGGATTSFFATRTLIKRGQIRPRTRKLMGFSASSVGALCVGLGTGLFLYGVQRWRSPRPIDMDAEISQAESAITLQRVGLGLGFAGTLPVGVGLASLVTRSGDRGLFQRSPNATARR